MENEQTKKQTDEGSELGKKADPTSEGDKKDLSEFDKLKASNDEFEKQLVRGRELKAESQKLEAEKMMAGTTGGHVEVKTVEMTDHDYRVKVQKEMSEGKTEFGN